MCLGLDLLKCGIALEILHIRDTQCILRKKLAYIFMKSFILTVFFAVTSVREVRM